MDEHEAANADAAAFGAPRVEGLQWSISQNCRLTPTNAFGTIEFEGGPHPLKVSLSLYTYAVMQCMRERLQAQYMRLGFDTDPADIIAHMKKFWKVEPPRLVITVHGGMTNFTYAACSA